MDDNYYDPNQYRYGGNPFLEMAIPAQLPNDIDGDELQRQVGNYGTASAILLIVQIVVQIALKGSIDYVWWFYLNV